MDLQPKAKLAVEMEMDGGNRMLGNLFVPHNQRLPDLLNDAQPFMSFETTDGIITVIRKSTIRRVTPQNQVTMPTASTDPYEVLGVAPSIEPAALQAVYERKSMESHPEKLAAIGMPIESIQLAKEKMSRIDDAYARILTAREAVEAAKPKWVMGG
jgi:DnaJ-domain-containing protein 1